MAKDQTQDVTQDTLRAEIIAMAVRDPSTLADVILANVKDAASLGRLSHAVRAFAPTKVRMPLKATIPDALLKVLEKKLHVISAVQDVLYPTPYAAEDKTFLDLSVTKGEKAAVIGGCIVSLNAVASLVARVPVDHLDQELEALGESIAKTCGGPATRRSLTRRTNATAGNTAKRSSQKATIPAADEPHLHTIQKIQAIWPGALNHPRQRGEANESYAKRLEGLMVTAAANGDQTADKACDEMRQSR